METASTGEDERRPADDDGRAGDDGIEIRVNGRPRTVAPDTTVADLLDELDVDSRRVAVERNQRIVPRDERDGTDLGPGDVVEIVQFVGGGAG